jgi:hypothetical protein
MVAYVVFTREKMRNRDEYEQYREKSRPINASHPLKPLALYGKHEVLEGPANRERGYPRVSNYRGRQDLLLQPRLPRGCQASFPRYRLPGVYR